MPSKHVVKAEGNAYSHAHDTLEDARTDARRAARSYGRAYIERDGKITHRYERAKPSKDA